MTEKITIKGSAVLTAVLLLAGMLGLAMIGIDILLSGNKAARSLGASTKAYYAAEAGVERALMAFKLYDLNITTNDVNYDDLLDSCRSADCLEQQYLTFVTLPCNGDACKLRCTPVAQSYPVSTGDVDPTIVPPPPGTVPTYTVKVATHCGSDMPGGVIINARGSYLDVNRELQVNFCLPDCRLKYCGDEDGCGGKCTTCSDRKQVCDQTDWTCKAP